MKRKNVTHNVNANMISYVLKGIILSMIITLILTILASITIHLGFLTEASIDYLSLVVVGVSAFFGAYYAKKEGRFLVGIFSAAGYWCLLCMITLICFERHFYGGVPTTILILGCASAASCLRRGRTSPRKRYFKHIKLK